MDERTAQIENLEKQLADSLAANRFGETSEGKLAISWLIQFINQGTNDILSDKYVNDHSGYLRANGQVAFARKFLAMLEAKKSQEAGIREQLDLAKSEQ